MTQFCGSQRTTVCSQLSPSTLGSREPTQVMGAVLQTLSPADYSTGPDVGFNTFYNVHNYHTTRSSTPDSLKCSSKE